ncbi:MAG: SIR2 family protein, partial [Saprospiraceae bacterium]
MFATKTIFQMTPAVPALTLRALSDYQVELLAEQIDLGKCVLILGPCATMTPEGLAIPTALAQTLGAELELPIAEPHNLAMAATAFQKQQEGGRLILERLVANFFRAQATPGALLEAVMRLPFRIILTTAQDNLLQHAFAAAGKPYQEGYYRLNQTQPDAFDETSNRPFVYQLFGKVDPVKGSDSLILTQQDQMDYLDSVQGVGKETRLPPALRKAMQDAKCFLFLGFDYENWYLRVLLHVLKLSEKAELVFGLPVGQPGNELSASAGAFFSTQYKFSFFAETAVNLLDKLRSKLAGNNGNPPQAAPKTLQLLYLNAPEDAAIVSEIDRSLSRLKEQFGLAARSINDLLPGARLDEARQQAVDEANLLLPILSADFVALDWLVDQL